MFENYSYRSSSVWERTPRPFVQTEGTHLFDRWRCSPVKDPKPSTFLPAHHRLPGKARQFGRSEWLSEELGSSGPPVLDGAKVRMRSWVETSTPGRPEPALNRSCLVIFTASRFVDLCAMLHVDVELKARFTSSWSPSRRFADRGPFGGDSWTLES